MIERTIFAFDNEALIVASSSAANIVGNGVINNSDTPDGTIFTFTANSGTTITVEDDGQFADAIAADNNLFFNDDELTDHRIIDGAGLIADGTEVEAESRIELQAVDAGGNPTGPLITVTVFSQNGVTQDVWGFSSDIPLVNGTQYIKVGGNNDGTTLYTDFITCFSKETLIKTKIGAQPIENILIGQKVWTLNNGFQSVRWIGHTRVAAKGSHAPVVFAPGSIGNEQELIVSQEHRMYLKSAHTELLFAHNDCLVAAKHLCGMPGVTLKEGGHIDYFHLMFDRHQIIMGNGILSESFFLSENSVNAIDKDQKIELLSLFPDLASGIQNQGATATIALKTYEAALLKAYAQNKNSSLFASAA
ncbi:Hint domain-containing protein [Roseovarius sp. EL26]|uniref:Hint domain-containing protein n=1 Tax=Roseovarius sp. EL26 TaxID=2126672 RepID=UPI000EA2854D|nr:Hint domain-containing protein [Roseovarius sp. EL26]